MSAAILTLQIDPALRRALDRLHSLHDGDIGVVEVSACGKRAVPALRALLLEGASSGIYQPRCRAVEALKALGAHAVLIEFLASLRTVDDPVDRTGEDAVVNAAARALIGLDDERVPPLLLQISRERLLAGVIEALGATGRDEAIPCLLRGLTEDHTRPAAEAALLRFGVRVCPALREIAMRPLPSAAAETVSSRRTRRSALRLLLQLGAPRPMLRALLHDADVEVAFEACRGLATAGSRSDRGDALARLIELLPHLPWFLHGDAEALLTGREADGRAGQTMP